MTTLSAKQARQLCQLIAEKVDAIQEDIDETLKRLGWGDEVEILYVEGLELLDTWLGLCQPEEEAFIHDKIAEWQGRDDGDLCGDIESEKADMYIAAMKEGL